MTYSVDRLSQRHIYIAAVLLSFLLSLLGFSHLFLPNISVDGVLYLRCAAAYSQGGLKAAMALYPWPFYSIMIAHLHQLGLSYITAAHLLDMLLQAWMVYFFIRIVFHFNPSPRVGVWALLCIICYSTFNGDRGILLRDFGYWAFYLTSFWAALVFLKTEKQRYLWLFGLNILVATLFRIEGVVIASCVILLFFCMPGWSFFARCRNSLIMAWPFGLGLVLLLLIGTHNLYGGGRLQDVHRALTHGLAMLLENKAQTVELMDKALKANYKFIHTEQMYFSMLIGFFFYKIVTCTEVVYSALAVYGWTKKALILNCREKILWYGLLITQALVLFVFLMNQLFLTSRYTLALSLLIVLWVPFSIEHLYQKSLIATRKWRLSFNVALGCFFIFSLLYSFVHIGPTKKYLYDNTLHWLQQHTGSSDRIAVNDPIVLYQVKGAIPTWNEDLAASTQENTCEFAAYRYVVIKFRRQDPIAHCTNLKLVQSYHNEKDAVANIYEVRR
ncbi:MAG: hypothetical protein K0R48_604 [Gammaproteobacteria bacterium]|jgi:hypothetical protein|nr:hypothetical protein [Gammaproteobacteria bacterium]